MYQLENRELVNTAFKGSDTHFVQTNSSCKIIVPSNPCKYCRISGSAADLSVTSVPPHAAWLCGLWLMTFML